MSASAPWENDPEIGKSAAPWENDPEIGKPKRTTAEDVARGGGLGARATIKGLLGIPLLAMDAGVSLGNLVNRGTNALGLTDAAQMPSASELTDQFLTKIGLASPETPGERIASDVQSAATGAGGIASAANALAGRAAPSVEKAVLEIMAKAPGMQVASGASAGASSGAAREAGLPWWAQYLAGIVGGIVPPASAALASEAAKAAVRGARELHKPFTESGRQDIAGATLRRLAVDPEAAAANMASNADEIVPGSLPTAAQASRDPGLLQAERALASGNAQFGARKSANNAARNRLLDEIAKTPDEISAAEGKRLSEGNRLYGEAFSSPLRSDAPLEPLIELTRRPAFQSAIKRAARIAQENGEDKLDILLDPKGLHYIKMALDDLVDTAPQSGIGRAEVRAIAKTRTDFLDWLTEASPAYKEAKSAYAEASKPINQMEAGQKIRAATRLDGPDVSGEPIISQSKWQRVVTNKLDDLGESLTKEQIKNLKAIGSDLDRASTSDTASKVAGSNTFQNLSTANVIGAAIGGKMANNPALKTLARPLQFLYRIPEQDVQDLLVQAMLDPKLARALMARGSEANVAFAAAALRDKARAIGIGATVGATEATDR